jgi:type II secretory pathway pseudopilin PulG
VSLLVRLSCRSVAIGQAERVLAQGAPSEAALRRFQALLEKEACETLLLNALRGERARTDRFAEELTSGKVKLSPPGLEARASFAGGDEASLERDLKVMGLTPGAGNLQRAALLRYMSRAVELAKQPPEKRRADFNQLDATVKEQPVLVRLLAPGFLGKICDADQRSQAQLRCAIAATAAERYRRDQGRWPASLDALKDSGYVRETPTDPYDGQALRWRRLDDGVVIYTLGPDGTDDGGKIDRQSPNMPGTDIGFRLWDAAARRQAPAPLPPPHGPD